MKLRTTIYYYLVWITPVLMLACATRDDAQSEPAVHWEASPRLSLGVALGDPALEFGNVVGAAKLSDGTLAIADYMHSEVRLFSPDGEHIRSVGGKGDGPGEFRSVVRLARTAGDTLIAGGVTRMSVFSLSGSHEGDLPLTWKGIATPPWRMETAWPLSTNMFLVKLLPTGASERPTGVMRRSPELYLVTRGDSVVVDPLGQYGGLEQLNYEAAGRTETAFPLFAAFTYPAVSDGYFAIGDTDADSVLVYKTSSGERSWVQVPLKPKAVSQEAWENAKAIACLDASEVEPCQRGLLNLPIERETTVFDGIAIDSLGTLWLKTPSLERDTVAEWLVVNLAGQAKGRVSLPSDARITQVGADYVVVIRRDSLGVSRVVEYAVSK